MKKSPLVRLLVVVFALSELAQSAHAIQRYPFKTSNNGKTLQTALLELDFGREKYSARRQLLEVAAKVESILEEREALVSPELQSKTKISIQTSLLLRQTTVRFELATGKSYAFKLDRNTERNLDGLILEVIENQSALESREQMTTLIKEFDTFLSSLQSELLYKDTSQALESFRKEVAALLTERKNIGNAFGFIKASPEASFLNLYNFKTKFFNRVGPTVLGFKSPELRAYFNEYLDRGSRDEKLDLGLNLTHFELVVPKNVTPKTRDFLANLNMILLESPKFFELYHYAESKGWTLVLDLESASIEPVFLEGLFKLKTSMNDTFMSERFYMDSDPFSAEGSFWKTLARQKLELTFERLVTRINNPKVQVQRKECEKKLLN